MKEILLLKEGEIALKGQNRSSFEDLLIKNAKRRLRALGPFSYFKAQSTIYVTPEDDGIDMDEAFEVAGRVFGVAAYCRACVVEKDYGAICEAAREYLAPALRAVKTFKVEAKRSDKSFPMRSPEICRELGGFLLESFPHLRVDVQNPDVVVIAEIRERGAYLHAGQLPGAGGIPVGSSGRAGLLISGGIDSPVAGYMMAKRGLELSAIHFESPPYTSERAREKVMALLQKLVPYCGRIKCYVVPFTKIQEEIRKNCPEDLFTIIMRRYMMRLSDRIAKEGGLSALVTGESLGQVASQTMLAMACTGAVTDLPIFRPVIGMDKNEIVAIARKIDTFETSILPYEDCCTVFTSRHPRTRPKLEMVEQAERALQGGALVEEAFAATETVWIREL